MPKRYIYHQGDDKYSLASMKKYLDRKQEMDKLLEKLIRPVIAGKKLNILDAGCGLGHSVFFLSQLSRQSQFLGVDQTPVYIKEAERLFKNLPQASFLAANIEDLPRRYPKKFDVAVSRAVISWVPYYEDFMRALFKVTKKHIFLSSLFYDGDVDFLSTIKMYKGESGKSKKLAVERRNVYSLPRFTKFVKKIGAKKVTATDFNIGIDLPRAPADQMSTYTVKLANGQRLQISGAVLMSWKWIRIDL